MEIKEKFSPSQLGLLLFTFVVSTIILTAPGTMVMTGKQDAWLSVVPAAASGLVSIWVMISLLQPLSRFDHYRIQLKNTGELVGEMPGGLLCLFLAHVYIRHDYSAH